LKLGNPNLLLAAAFTLMTILFWSACDSEPRKTDAELGLTPQQAQGRHVYDTRCAECHYAYSTHDLKAPSLNGLFRRPNMKNGIPANDARVADVILIGRPKMPSFQNKLTKKQFDDLMAYLHTL
jgi:mono/diheme cytochrome c family protein